MSKGNRDGYLHGCLTGRGLKMVKGMMFGVCGVVVSGMSWGVTTSEALNMSWEGQFSTMPYRVFDASEASASEKKPLIIFMHGSGERRSELSSSQINRAQINGSMTPIVDVSLTSEFNSYVVAPNHNSRNGVLDTGFVEHLLTTLPHVDPKRVYVTGLSAGGIGTLIQSHENPHLIAGGIALGSQNKDFIPELGAQGVPLWIFHGEDDGTFNHAQISKMYSDLRANGSPSRYTLINNIGHSNWSQMYNDKFSDDYVGGHGRDLGKDTVWEWLFNQNLDARDNVARELMSGEKIRIDFGPRSHSWSENGKDYAEVLMSGKLEAADDHWNDAAPDDVKTARRVLNVTRNTTGDLTEIGLEIVNPFSYWDYRGEDGSVVFTEDKMADTWYVDGNKTATLKLTGLEAGAHYRLLLTGSKQGHSWTKDFETEFTINGEKAWYNADDNVDDYAEYTDVVADENGELLIDVTGSSRTGNKNGYLGALELEMLTIPEPSVFGLMGLGLLAIGMRRRK
ncbi:PEP-CTERM sorting domain-containing protein [Planctomycetota bacterium]|nr:PEP-CTERM sorting domain-containing protein [Planctomycetota bacterium]